MESLLSVLCEETDIAEVELKMGSFKMRVRRSLKGGAAAAAAAPAPVAAAPPPAPAAPAPAASFAPSVSSLEATADEDESLLDITANKVRPAVSCAWWGCGGGGLGCCPRALNPELHTPDVPAAGGRQACRGPRVAQPDRAPYKPCACPPALSSPPQVGILRRGRYMKGKQVGKGEMVKVGDQVSSSCLLSLAGTCSCIVHAIMARARWSRSATR